MLISDKPKVIIAGAGLAGLAAAKYLLDLGFAVTILEKRDRAGGKVSSWQDEEGDWLESGLHVFFGAYRNLLAFLRETGTYENLVWMPHVLTFSKPGGPVSELRFPAALPAPLNGLTAIAGNRRLLTNPDKFRTGFGLLWPILCSQGYIDRQDNVTYATWHLRHGLSRRSLVDFFDTMALALNFSDSKDVSAKLLLTVLSHFGKETDASRVAFLGGPPETYLFQPLLKYLERRGAQVSFGNRVVEIEYDAASEDVRGFRLENGERVQGDLYVSAMPAHSLWKILSAQLRSRASLSNLRHLHGVPVMTVQLYFDRPVTGVNNLVFSSGTHMSVYAELSQIAPGFRDTLGDRSMVELVVAPAAQWFNLDDQEITARLLAELTTLHPAAGTARLVKSSVVRIPQSVYKAVPGADNYRPAQKTPIGNFYLCGDFTRQEYLASMEGAVLSGKMVAEQVSKKSRERQGAAYAS